MAERHFYHGSWVGNIPSIKEKGLVSKSEIECEALIDKILTEYGETRDSVPKYYWQYPLWRCVETAGKVHITGDRNYAICNCLAGYEAETELRSHLEARKEHRKMRHLTTEEAMKREMPCAICEVILNEEDIPKEETDNIKERAIHAAKYMPEKFPTVEAGLDYIYSKGTIVLNKNIPPEKIKECKSVREEICPLPKLERER